MAEKDITLDDEEFFGKSSEVKPSSVVTSAPASEVSEKSDAKPASSQGATADESGGIPELRGTDFPKEFIDMADRLKATYRLLPKINYDAIYKELGELSVKSSPTPTLQVLNDELHKIQGSKDRLSEILINVIKCYNHKNRVVDILKDSWGKFTTEKNTEGRKGDAVYRLSNFLADFAEIEALSKVCNHVLKNLDSLHDNLSRRITIWQLMLKLRDVGRGALPDTDFHRPESMTDIFNVDKEDDKDEDGNPKLRDF